MSDNETDVNMAPESSPGAVSKKTGVRRVNNIPVYIIGGVLLVFLTVMVLVASDRASQQNKPASEDTKKRGGNTSMFAKEIIGDQADGIIPAQAAKPLKVPDDALTVPIARAVDLDKPPIPPARPPKLENPQNTQRNDEQDRIRMAKLQEFIESVKANTAVQISKPRSNGKTNASLSRDSRPNDIQAQLAAVRQQLDNESSDDPTAAYKARLAQIKRSGLAGASAGSSSPRQSVQSAKDNNNDYNQFNKTGKGDRWNLDTQVEAPDTPYQLRAGFVLPALLIAGINSDLPGQISAQVSQNVYDTATGKHLLVPQGSKLVGSYSSDVIYGQARVLVAWQRIIFPDGKALDIGSMPGSDSAGYSGFSDQVNNHYFRLFASAFLMSGVTAGISYSQREDGNNNSQSARGALSEALGQQLGQVTAQLIAKNMNIAPTLEIRPGYRFNVTVTKDLTFTKPYQSFDY